MRAAPLRIVDVAIFYAERSGGIRTYLDAKAAYARATGAYEHHLVIPGAREHHAGNRHELPSVLVSRSSGYRLPVGSRRLHALLAKLGPDVVILHDPYWRPAATATFARSLGATAVIVHHCSTAHAAAASPFPRLASPVLRAWFGRTYRRVGTVMAAGDQLRDPGAAAHLELRLGVDPAFRPQPGVDRREHVLYAGRFSPEKCVLDLLEAAALARDPWPLLLVGAGPLERAIRREAKRMRIADRVTIRPFVRDRSALARLYAAAACVAVPGRYDTFGLVVLEAAASGAPVVACDTSPAAARIGSLAHRYRPGDVAGLCAAIDAARMARPDPGAAAALAERSSWERALSAELADLTKHLDLGGKVRAPPTGRSAEARPVANA